MTLNSSLAEPMQIKDDYIHASFINEFENVDHSDFVKPLRQIKPTFSDENEFRKDI